MSMDDRRRIALFGGTFDPIHAGHLEIARLAKDSLALDEVRFLPCHTSPHKVGVLTAAPENRLKMVRLAITGHPWATVDDYDLRAPQPAYSYRTAEEMTRRFPQARLFWLMGADQWRALPSWKNPERLADLVEFIVFARDGAPIPHPGWTAHFIEETHPASATAIRQRLSAGLPSEGWLPLGVADYIHRKGLYKP